MAFIPTPNQRLRCGASARLAKSKAIVFDCLTLCAFNFNGVDKSLFLAETGLHRQDFTRDTKELIELGFLKVIDHKIFINPRIIFYGEDKIRAYRIKCWDANVVRLSKDDATEEDYKSLTLECEALVRSLINALVLTNTDKY